MKLPDDLIALQRDYDAADARCTELAAALPSAVETLDADADPDDPRMAAFNAARDERLRLALALSYHPWWARVRNRYEAQRQLYEAARATQETTP